MAKVNIMIVEDDAITAMDIKEQLKNLGYVVTAKASRGEDAIQKAKENAPDLVLMDIVLKGKIDGIEAAEQIRTQFGIPVIFLTAHADKERLNRAKLANPYGYLLKPFQDRDLEVTIEMALYVAKVDAERKQIEEKLTKSEMLHKEAQSVAKIGHWSLDSPSGTPVWSEEIFHIVGLDPMLSKPSFAALVNIIHDEDWDLLDHSIQDLSVNGTPFDIEFRILRTNGETRWMHAKGFAEKDENNRVARMFGTAQDITDHKQTVEALRESENKFRNLFDSSIDPVYITTQEGFILDVNQAFLDLFGYTIGDMQDMNVQAMYANPDDRMIFRQDIGRRKYIKDYELKLRKKDGTSIECLVSASVRKKSDGTILGYQGVIRDITEKKRVEEALLGHKKQLRHLSSQLIEAQEKERKRISLELHDEMGQTLASVGINLGIIEKNLPPDCPRIIKNKLDEIDFMIEQASDRIRELSLHLRPPILDDLGLIPTLRWLLSRLESSVKVVFDYKQIDDKDRLSQEIETVIYRVVQEATTKILKHAEAKEVVVNLNIEEGISLIVKDDGKGFGAKDQKITDDLKAGIGILGMNERVEMLGGKFDIQSRKGYGTRISVEIPLY